MYYFDPPLQDTVNCDFKIVPIKDHGISVQGFLTKISDSFYIYRATNSINYVLKWVFTEKRLVTLYSIPPLMGAVQYYNGFLYCILGSSVKMADLRYKPNKAIKVVRALRQKQIGIQVKTIQSSKIMEHV